MADMTGDAPELVHLPALRLAGLIRDGEVTAVEVMEAHLERIADRNPTVNAIVAVAPDALEQAAAADRARAQGEALDALHGVPFTAKDIIETADLPTTLGMVELAGNRPETDATIVKRMRQAGAILLGKSNCPPGGGGGETVNELHGRTTNPYDPTLSPAGSSGGEAAVVASGMSACGLGSDSGGSLRMPARFCGIATLKPTAGRVPITGVLDDLGPLGPMSDPRTQPGPMARSVDDLSAMLEILAGPDGRDGGAPPVPLGDPARLEVAGLRVRLQLTDGTAEPEPAIGRAVRDAARALADAWAHVTEALLPWAQAWRAIVRATCSVQPGYRRRIASANAATKRSSRRARASAARLRCASRRSASARHSASARWRASSSTSSPCRS
jgi:amidase